MIENLILVFTVVSIGIISYNRINKEIIKKLKRLIYITNEQYIDFIKGKYSDLKIWQLTILIISQIIIVFSIVRRLSEEVYKYVNNNYLLAIKISTYLIIFVILYFIVGYVMYSTKKIYKYLYKIEDKNTKTDLLIKHIHLQAEDISAIQSA